MGHRASRLRDGRSAIPRWRRARPGWLLVHVLFGLGLLGLAHIVLAGLVILEVREGAPSRDRLLSWAALGTAIALTFLGWLLFVYLRRSRGARWSWLVLLVLLGAAVNAGGQLLAEGALAL